MHDDELKVLDQEDALDATAPEETMDIAPHYTHSLMDILLPANPPKPVNARVIRRLKD